MQLRDYQQQAIDSVYEYLRGHEDNPCIVIPTGGGKTPVIAQICKDAVDLWGGRVLIIAHVKELLEQTMEKLDLIAPELECGVYSAGLNHRDTDNDVIVGGIQSIYRRAGILGAFDLIIVDEAHMIPPDGEGMYRRFLGDAEVMNPNVRVIGLTATPYRTTSAEICQKGDSNILNSVCFEQSVRGLISANYLCQLKSKAGSAEVDTSDISVRGGEFVAGELEQLMDKDHLVKSACAEIIEYTGDRKACLIFASGVDHGRHITQTLVEQHNVDCRFVYGDMAKGARIDTLRKFRDGQFKYLCNVNVLTTGFDAPHIDCIVMLRPTMSPGLYYQMVGRGFRICEGKGDCLVLDYGNNVVTHGPVDKIKPRNRRSGAGEAPAKKCPECASLIASAYRSCPDCGYEFPEADLLRDPKHETKAGTEAILSGEITEDDWEVRNVWYSRHVKRGTDADDDSVPKTLRVQYDLGGLSNYKSEWVCIEHGGYARTKAEHWWGQRSKEPCPRTVAEALDIIETTEFRKPVKITIRHVSGEKYDNIVKYQLEPWGEGSEGTLLNLREDEIPF